MSIDLEYFRLFCSVAFHKSISRAAEELHLSQPTVTKELHRLEDQVGFPLFVRHSRGVRLTQEGEYLYRRLSPIMAELTKAEAETADMRSMKSGTIRVTCNSTVTETVLAAFVEEFQRSYPGIRVVTCVNPRSMTCALLNSGVVNVALASRPADFAPSEPPDFAATHLWRPDTLHGFSLGCYPDVFLAGERLGHLSGRTLRFSDLAPYPLLFQRILDHIGRGDYLAQIGQTPQVQEDNIICEDLTALLKFLRRTESVAIVTSICAQVYQQTRGVFPLDLDETLHASEYMLFYSRQTPPGPAALAFIDFFLSRPTFSVRKLDSPRAAF